MAVVEYTDYVTATRDMIRMPTLRITAFRVIGFLPSERFSIQLIQ